MNIFAGGTPMGNLVALRGGGDVARQRESEPRQAPPFEECNAAWDPGCPRPLPTRTMVPYIPSTKTDGPIFYSIGTRRTPKDRSGRIR